jgi:signal recognition particle subunit SRP54
MFENISERLLRTIKNLRGQGRLTEENIKDALREVRMALLEADVALPVVRAFVDRVRHRAIGEEVLLSLTPGQVLIKIVYEELTIVMGEAGAEINLRVQPPAVVLIAGLQGSGKTTSVAKLARWIRERQRKRVMVVSCDIYRPAAIEQLRKLAEEVGAEFFPSSADQKPEVIARHSLEHARLHGVDVLIVDSAGRLHIDKEMMTEIQLLHTVLNPIETLFVVDSMTGQDAANTARIFDKALPLTGVVLTKTDGDARGGAALSIRYITGKPIKFLGIGEKTMALEQFYPDRVASRILGKGDVLSLIDEIEHNVDKEKALKLAQKVQKGRGFDLEDFREQMEQMLKMGGISNFLDKMPGLSNTPTILGDQASADKEVKRLVAIINSMTIHERRFPEIIKGSRKRRIAVGSGNKIQDVNRLLKQFNHAQKIIKKVKIGGLMKLFSGIQHKGGLVGSLPTKPS